MSDWQAALAKAWAHKLLSRDSPRLGDGQVRGGKLLVWRLCRHSEPGVGNTLLHTCIFRPLGSSPAC